MVFAPFTLQCSMIPCDPLQCLKELHQSPITSMLYCTTALDFKTISCSTRVGSTGLREENRGAQVSQLELRLTGKIFQIETSSILSFSSAQLAVLLQFAKQLFLQVWRSTLQEDSLTAPWWTSLEPQPEVVGLSFFMTSKGPCHFTNNLLSWLGSNIKTFCPGSKLHW